MKQHGDHEWCGHREITYAAVGRMFSELAGPDGTVRGATQEQYAAALDKAQAYMDRPVGAGLIDNFANSGRRFPYAGPGPTAHSAYANPNAQAEHFMANPYPNGLEPGGKQHGARELAVDTGYVVDRLRQARQSLGGDMIQHLGAAAHALQDSYSGAHAWRDLSVYRGDPTAGVSKLHVFTPLHAVGIDDGKNTHADEFDKPPAASGSTEAAIEATYRMLSAHERGLRDPDRAEELLRETMEPLLQPSARGVEVSLTPDAAWQAERDYRMGVEQGTIPLPEPGVQHYGAESGRVSESEKAALAKVLAPHAGGRAAAARADTGARADTAARDTGVRGKSPGQGLARG
ncbi:hypothetical protein Kfla_2420 [Kribbella flavida DSM 17836]|uniref:Uncharacterized protein n=1 Tax=Kribbella flavida (strain DSM 17836 / JCM 10339 / NBRC 14399) TaxID=479435 RepID=D2PV28_KRIFD|nr:hypothetical protein [Kribbella flavida]ADB31494.1 hypothetical protein Kfla_2420 [Kribbella flavida DSM 17836]